MHVHMRVRTRVHLGVCVSVHERVYVRVPLGMRVCMCATVNSAIYLCISCPLKSGQHIFQSLQQI